MLRRPAIHLGLLDIFTMTPMRDHLKYKCIVNPMNYLPVSEVNSRKHSLNSEDTPPSRARHLQYKSTVVQHVTPFLPHRISVCKMVLSESSYCPACNSFFHAADTCPKTLFTYQPVSNTLVGHGAHTGANDLRTQNPPTPPTDLALELHLRSILSEGLGSEDRRCNEHRMMQLQLLNNAPSGRHASVTIVLDALDDCCLVSRSLLPLCSTCVHDETGLEATALPLGLDMCWCTTKLVRAACPSCVLFKIHAVLKYEVFKRTKSGEDGSCEIAYRCGKAITAEVTAVSPVSLVAITYVSIYCAVPLAMPSR